MLGKLTGYGFVSSIRRKMEAWVCGPWMVNEAAPFRLLYLFFFVCLNFHLASVCVDAVAAERSVAPSDNFEACTRAGNVFSSVWLVKSICPIDY